MSFLRALSPQQADSILPDVDEGFQDAVHGLADQISLLHKVSNTIRRASKDVRNIEAAKAFRIGDDEVDGAEDFFRLNLTYYVRDHFPMISEAIQQRLAATMVTRRKRILYRRSRYGSTPIRVQDTPSQPDVRIPQARPIIQPQKADEHQETGASQSKAHSRVKSLAQSATTLAADKFHKASAPSVVSMSKTVALSSHEELVFPPAPTGAIRSKQRQLKEQRGDTLRQRLEGQDSIRNAGYRAPGQDWEDAVNAIGEVMCPFCFYALPACDVVDEKKWKRHVMNDLEAYVCLFEECQSPEELYSHSSQWLEHMRGHASRWRCASKSHGEFLGISKEEYIEHMKTTHRSKLSDAQLRLLADKSARNIGPLFKSCPLCGDQETRSTMEEHVVGHLRLLALKSLPTYEDGEIENNDDASAIGSGTQSQKTIQDFMNSQADDTSWGTRSVASSTSLGIHFPDPDLHVISRGSGSDNGSSDDYYMYPGKPIQNQSVLPKKVIYMDPPCAICRAPAEQRCACETQALETAVRQAEERMMTPIRNDIRAWVKARAEERVSKKYQDAIATYSNSEPQMEPDEVAVNEAAAKDIRKNPSKLWGEAYMAYPETMDYFYSLVKLNLPANNEQAVRNPRIPPSSNTSENPFAPTMGLSTEEEEEKEEEEASPTMESPGGWIMRTPGGMEGSRTDSQVNADTVQEIRQSFSTPDVLRVSSAQGPPPSQRRPMLLVPIPETGMARTNSIANETHASHSS